MKDSGVSLPQTRHFKPAGFRDINEKGIQRILRKEEGLINAVAEEETETVEDSSLEDSDEKSVMPKIWEKMARARTMEKR